MSVFETINADKIINNAINEQNKKKNYDELVESILSTLNKEELKMVKEFILGFPEYASKNGVTPHKYKSTEILGGKFIGWSLENGFYISISGEIYEKKVKLESDSPDRIYYKKSNLDKLVTQKNCIRGWVEGHILHIGDSIIDLDCTQYEISEKVKEIVIKRVQNYAEKIIKTVIDDAN